MDLSRSVVSPSAVVAEWLRRWTRNPMGVPRAGSNPAGCVNFFSSMKKLNLEFGMKEKDFSLLLLKGLVTIEHS